MAAIFLGGSWKINPKKPNVCHIFQSTIWDGWFWHLKNVGVFSHSSEVGNWNKLCQIATSWCFGREWFGARVFQNPYPPPPVSNHILGRKNLRSQVVFSNQGLGGCFGHLHLRSFISRGRRLGNGWVGVQRCHEVYAKKGDLGTRRKLLGEVF